MKGTLRKVLSLGLVGVMMISFTACGSSTASTATSTVSKTASQAGISATASTTSTKAASASSTGSLQKLGYLSASWSDDYCKRLSDAMVKLGPDYGFEVNALNGAPDGNPDVTKYQETIDALLTDDPDAIVIQPLYTVPDYCMKFNKQIPLTFLNISPEISDTSKDLVYYYAGCYDVNIGAQLAEKMANGLKDGAKICMLNLTYGQTNTAQREQGFKEWMKANRSDVEILECNYVEKIDPSNAQTIFEDWIQKYGVSGFDGVATQGSMLTQGVVECMKKYNLNTTNFTLAGISASTTEWIKDGYEYVELYQDPYAEAKAALECSRAQLDGTTDKLTKLEGTDNVVAVDMTPITTKNVADFDF